MSDKPAFKADDFMNTSLKKATVNKSGGVRFCSRAGDLTFRLGGSRGQGALRQDFQRQWRQLVRLYSRARVLRIAGLTRPFARVVRSQKIAAQLGGALCCRVAASSPTVRV